MGKPFAQDTKVLGEIPKTLTWQPKILDLLPKRLG